MPSAKKEDSIYLPWESKKKKNAVCMPYESTRYKKRHRKYTSVFQVDTSFIEVTQNEKYQYKNFAYLKVHVDKQKQFSEASASA